MDPACADLDALLALMALLMFDGGGGAKMSEGDLDVMVLPFFALIS